MSERNKKLKRYILPAMLANMSYFVLTIIDGMFVGNGVGTDALGAIALAMPFLMLFSAFTVLFNIGGIAVTAVRMGRGDVKGANDAFMHSLTLNLVFNTLLTLLGTLFSDRIALFLGANDTYVTMVSDYIFWYSVFLVPTALFYCFNGFARNDGNPELPMKTALACTIANIVGDWVAIYPLGMGVKGAAIATGLAGVVAFFVASSHFVFKKGSLRIRSFRLQGILFRKVLLRGLPEMISEFSAPLTTYFMNLMLITYLGNAAVNAYSIINYAATLFISLVWGLAGGLQPLYGLSYGAKDDASLHYYFHKGRLIALVGGVSIFVLTFVLGQPVAVFFGADAETAPIVVDALPKYCLNFVFMALSAVISAYLYSTKRTAYAIPLNVCRGLLLNVLCINLLPHLFGYEFVWYTMAVAEGISLVIAIVLQRLSERGGIVYR